MFKSLVRSIKILIISAFIIVCMPIIACAAPKADGLDSLDGVENLENTETEDGIVKSFFEVFSIDERYFIYYEPHNNSDINDMSDMYIGSENESSIKKRDINSFTYLYLSKGFEEKDNNDEGLKLQSRFIDAKPTFESTHNIKGNGEEDTLVGIMVYDGWGDEGNLNITYQSDYQTIGPSGIYNEKIHLNTIGINYICIAVKKDSEVEYNIYMVNRKKEETKEILENIEIKFDGEDSTNQQEETEIDEEIIDENTFNLLNLAEPS
ncbi:hypothetical protein SH1V18_11600 [Vallitalea longa]|uniref:Uncharacterized protein n=1 Tax=Vallitalea longa TaxID=2936439 RepID=A0A9W6DDT0_9FIRM|nr:hypothetical protein [Vallitalea longa]GKX28680.1 hypothetical protein SH1V18_11600 [Vallitalea longa]